MNSYPTLTSADPTISLAPLQPENIDYLVSLLNEKEIQKTLFAGNYMPISKKSQQKQLRKMWDLVPPTSLTYIISKNDTPVGYTRLKLIDWPNRHSYIAIAITPDPNYRNQGIATTAYKSFIDYTLHKLGMLNIYARIYMNNVASVRLHQKLGFITIGNQPNFILKTDSALKFPLTITTDTDNSQTLQQIIQHPQTQLDDAVFMYKPNPVL